MKKGESNTSNSVGGGGRGRGYHPKGKSGGGGGNGNSNNTTNNNNNNGNTNNNRKGHYQPQYQYRQRGTTTTAAAETTPTTTSTTVATEEHAPPSVIAATEIASTSSASVASDSNLESNATTLLSTENHLHLAENSVGMNEIGLNGPTEGFPSELHMNVNGHMNNVGSFPTLDHQFRPPAWSTSIGGSFYSNTPSPMPSASYPQQSPAFPYQPQPSPFSFGPMNQMFGFQPQAPQPVENEGSNEAYRKAVENYIVSLLNPSMGNMSLSDAPVPAPPTHSMPPQDSSNQYYYWGRPSPFQMFSEPQQQPFLPQQATPYLNNYPSGVPTGLSNLVEPDTTSQVFQTEVSQPIAVQATVDESVPAGEKTSEGSLTQAEKPVDNPSTYLSQKQKLLSSVPHTDFNKLTKEVADLVVTVRASQHDVIKRTNVLNNLQRIIATEWPAANLQMFGSSANDFAFKNADCDLCLSLPPDETTPAYFILNKMAELLKKRKMTHIKPLPFARVPIIKFSDPRFNISCDICINNKLALRNTQLIRDYARIDSRFQYLGYFVKYWAKRRQINEPYSGTLSSYAYLLLVINFLQQREPPILPCLQQMKKDTSPPYMIDGYDCYFMKT